VLARLAQEFGTKGLVILSPTHATVTPRRQEVTPEEELKYIDQVRQQYYPNMPCRSVRRTSKLRVEHHADTVLIDRQGVFVSTTPQDELRGTAATGRRIAG